LEITNVADVQQIKDAMAMNNHGSRGVDLGPQPGQEFGQFVQRFDFVGFRHLQLRAHSSLLAVRMRGQSARRSVAKRAALKIRYVKPLVLVLAVSQLPYDGCERGSPNTPT